MSITKLSSLPEETLQDLILSHTSATEVCRELGLPPHPRSCKFVNDFKRRGGLSYSSRRQKYLTIPKECPVCSRVFTTKEGHPREKVTCSYSCANSYTKSGPHNGNFKGGYRSSTFYFHGKKCAVCDEDKIVEVHHHDGVHSNNDPSNLVPLCPTHHQYVHSRFYPLILDEIEQYLSTR